MMQVLKLTTKDGEVFFTKEPMTPAGVAFAAGRLGWEVDKSETVEMTEAEYAAIPAQPEADRVFGETP